jgi:hypothetical protein
VRLEARVIDAVEERARRSSGPDPTQARSSGS